MIISVAIHVLKAAITVHYKNSFNEHIFTIKIKENTRISASEIKVIEPKASKIWLSFLCILLLQSHNKVTSRRFLVGCTDCRFLVQFSPLALAFQRQGSSFRLSMTMILVYSHSRC